MSLHFSDRKMGDAIIAVLKNVYYYTGRWRLSVASFTGKNTDYWKCLPQMLRQVLNQPKHLEKIIIELEELANNDSKRKEKHQALVKENGFQNMEVVVNEQLLTILSALPYDLLAKCLRILMSQVDLPAQARLVERHMGSGEQLIEPDFLVMAEQHLIMGELKVKGASKTSDTRYDANQLHNYLSLVVKCRAVQNESLPNKFTHLILLPSVEHRWFVRGDEWVTELQTSTDRRMKINPATCFAIANKDKKQRYVKSATTLSALLDEVPVYCRTFGDLAEAFGKAVSGYPLEEHWLRMQKELEELAVLASAGVNQ